MRFNKHQICCDTDVLSLSRPSCRDVHAVCLWDDKGPAKIHQALKEDILDFIKQAQAVSGEYLVCFHDNVVDYAACERLMKEAGRAADDVFSLRPLSPLINRSVLHRR